MGEGFVALPLHGAAASRAGFLPAGGLVNGAGKSAEDTPVQLLGPPRPTLVIAGCYPALFAP